MDNLDGPREKYDLQRIDYADSAVDLANQAKKPNYVQLEPLRPWEAIHGTQNHSPPRAKPQT
jgi:hypothetical protein